VQSDPVVTSAPASRCLPLMVDHRDHGPRLEAGNNLLIEKKFR